MKIVCPSCEASYEVPEAVVAARRPVRCARCGNDWVPGDTPAAAPVAAEPEPEPEPDAEFIEAPEAAPDAAALVPARVEHEPADQPAAADAIAEPEPVLVTPPHPEVEPAFEPPPPSPAPPVPPAAPLPPVEDVRPVPRAAVPRPAAPRPDVLRTLPPPPPRQPALAWAASLLIILGALGAGILFRAPIIKAWPPSTRLYAALGLYEKR